MIMYLLNKLLLEFFFVLPAVTFMILKYNYVVVIQKVEIAYCMVVLNRLTLSHLLFFVYRTVDVCLSCYF